MLLKGDPNLSEVHLETAPYQKKPNSYMYIPWSSYHPLVVRKSLIPADLIRYVRLSSEFTSLAHVRKQFFFWHRARGYPGRWLRPILLEVKWFERRASSLLPKVLLDPSAEEPLIFKTSYNPLWEQLNVQSVLQPLKADFLQYGLLDNTDRIIVSQSIEPSLGDLANAGHKKSLL